MLGKKRKNPSIYIIYLKTDKGVEKINATSILDPCNPQLMTEFFWYRLPDGTEHWIKRKSVLRIVKKQLYGMGEIDEINIE